MKMAALKTGIGTIVIVESVYRRLKADSAMMRRHRRTIADLRAELEEAYRRIDDQNERIVDYRAEREECTERVQAMSKAITERTAA